MASLTATSSSTIPSSSSARLGSDQVIEIHDTDFQDVAPVVDDDEPVDPEQLEEYKEMIEELGTFPEKVKINSLSMVAGDFAESRSGAQAIYQIIKHRLLHTTRDHLLPLVYVLDSILKNVKGYYIDLVQDDAPTWMPQVYRRLQDQQRARLQKVWQTWNEFDLFPTDRWKAMGRCFDQRTTASVLGTTTTTATTSHNTSSSITNNSIPEAAALSNPIAGITRTREGRLLLAPALRAEMQNILDDIQSSEQNELNKVSLERLAEINPDLLVNIKMAAEGVLKELPGGPAASAAAAGPAASPAYLTETRSASVLARAQDWQKLSWDPWTEAPQMQNQWQQQLAAAEQALYTQPEAIQLTYYLAAASAASTLLQDLAQRIQQQQQQLEQASKSSKLGTQARAGISSNSSLVIDKNDFHNDGIRIKNETVIGLLYDVGLPFVSSSDGKRFANQMALSRHLDALFRMNQLEKSMARTEERGWYQADVVWTGQMSAEDLTRSQQTATATLPAQAQQLTHTDQQENDPDSFTMPADEYRDRCAICGINFKMFFDNDEGIYRYSNCREIEVLNDDAAEEESDQALVHVTCWTGLGSPAFLTADQILPEVLSPKS